MPISYTSYTATGGQTNFPITFPYLTASDVYVDIDGVNTTAFSLVGTDVVLTSGATANEIVKVYRITPGRTDSSKILLVDFQDGSVLSEADLDKVSQQLLYLMQETYDTSAIPIDYDGNYDAGSKRLKNLSPSVLSKYDAATKSYVDGVSAYDGTVTVVPQIWNKTGADFTGTVVADGVSGDCTITAGFIDPVPSSDVEELYIVAYNGFTQRPNTDFSITELDGVYTFTLKMGSVVLEPTHTVTIYNFGVARSYLTQPLVSETDETVGLVIKRFSEDQTANIQEWQNESGTPLAKVAADGDATFVDINATGNGDVDGNLNVDGTLTVDGASTLTGDITTGGAVTAAGQLTANSLRIPYSSGNPGIRSTDESTYPGVIYFSPTGPIMHYDTNHYIVSQKDEVFVEGDLKVSGGDFIIDGEVSNATNGLTHRSNAGSFTIGSLGPSIKNGINLDNYITVTGDSNYLRGYTSVVEGDFDVTNGNTDLTGTLDVTGTCTLGQTRLNGYLSVNKTSAPVAPLDIAHDGSVPSIGGLVLATPAYKEYHYIWDKGGDIATLDKLTTTLTCPSYFSAEIIFTQHQTNSGQNNLYFKAFWNNSHHNHHLDILSGSVTNETGSQGESNDLPSWTGEIAGIGGTDHMTTKLSLSHDPDTAQGGGTAPYNSGKLVIEEDYTASGTYSFSTLEVRVYSGTLVTPTHVRTDT